MIVLTGQGKMDNYLPWHTEIWSFLAGSRDLMIKASYVRNFEVELRKGLCPLRVYYSNYKIAVCKG